MYGNVLKGIETVWTLNWPFFEITRHKSAEDYGDEIRSFRFEVDRVNNHVK